MLKYDGRITPLQLEYWNAGAAVARNVTRLHGLFTIKRSRNFFCLRIVIIIHSSSPELRLCKQRRKDPFTVKIQRRINGDATARGQVVTALFRRLDRCHFGRQSTSTRSILIISSIFLMRLPCRLTRLRVAQRGITSCTRH